jgi:hypothetical protein
LCASGSTLVLDFVFGPYVMEMAWVHSPVQNQVNKTAAAAATTTTTTTTAIETTTQLLQVTTRNIFGWKNTHLINPTVHGVFAPYTGGMRPFANLLVVLGNCHGQSRTVPWYVHPELLDDTTRKLLFSSSSSTTTKTTTIMLPPNHHLEEKGAAAATTTAATTYTDREGLPKSINNNNNNNN